MASAPPLRRDASGRSHPLQEHSLVPVGMATILPEAARHVRQLESQLLAQINRWGYDEIILPTFEYLDVLSPGLDPRLIENCYKIVDRSTGRILLLRPDATAQIARTIAMGMLGTHIPLRLSYRATVYRYEPEHAGRDREVFQVGAELIGADDAIADCEIVTLLIECLQQVGLRQFKVSLGHVGFFKGLLIRAGLSAEGQKLAEEAAARKDLPHLETLLRDERVAKGSTSAILEATELCGHADVLKKGYRLAKGEKPLVQALDRLTQVYQLLCSTGLHDVVLLDLGEFRGFDYYDGIVFDVFAEGIGAELGGGGRYDQLLGRFGRNIPSTGFALNVHRLCQSLKVLGTPSPLLSNILAVARPESAQHLLTVAAQLRQAGLRVTQQVLDTSTKKLIDAAVEAGTQRQTDCIVIVGADQATQDHVVVLEGNDQPSAKGTQERPRMRKMVMSIEDLVRMQHWTSHA